jgi:CubicO group peptidase (beta-lactamase class C family)
MISGLRIGLVVVSFCLATAPAQGQADEAGRRIEQVVTRRFQSTNCPGMSIAVARHGRIAFSRAYGLADIEQNVPARVDSVHRLASISKPITATIVMSLVEAGKLRLDSPVRDYLPELPATYRTVTIRHLLNHQSGIRGYKDPADVAFSTTHYATSRDAIRTFLSYPLEFGPGQKTEYSSLAFTVAGAAVEAATGSTFQRAASDFFTEHHVGGFALDDPLAIVPKRVRGYLTDRASTIRFTDGRVMDREYLAGTQGAVTNSRAYDVSNRYPAAGFTSSAEDLVRFVLRLADGKVVQRESLRQLWTPSTTSDGKQSVFGLGWGVSEWKGHKMVGMNGAGPGTTAFLRFFPDSNSAVALLCNAEGARDLPELLEEVLALTNSGNEMGRMQHRPIPSQK